MSFNDFCIHLFICWRIVYQSLFRLEYLSINNSFNSNCCFICNNWWANCSNVDWFYTRYWLKIIKIFDKFNSIYIAFIMIIGSIIVIAIGFNKVDGFSSVKEKYAYAISNEDLYSNKTCSVPPLDSWNLFRILCRLRSTLAWCIYRFNCYINLVLSNGWYCNETKNWRIWTIISLSM